MSCNSCNDNVSTGCNGCASQINSKCIIYTGEILGCIATSTNTDLETILENINAAICALDPLTERITIVDSANPDHVTVTSTVAGSTTTYHVDVSNVTLLRITNLETSVTNINNTLADLPISIITNTPSYLTVSHPAPNSWIVDFTGSLSTCGGVIYANNAKLTRPVTDTYTTTKYYTTNYLTTHSIQNGEVIKVKTTFQIPLSGPTDNPGYVERYCQLSVGAGAFLFKAKSPDTKQSPDFYLVEMEIEIHVVSKIPLIPNNALITGVTTAVRTKPSEGDSSTVFSPNNQLVSPNFQPICHTVNNYCSLDWTNLDIIAGCTGSTISTPAQSNLFSVELVKLK